MDGEKPKIEIIWGIPIVFTRNKEFGDYVTKHGPFRSGDVVILPDDAVLAKLPPEEKPQLKPPANLTRSTTTEEGEPVIQ